MMVGGREEVDIGRTRHLVLLLSVVARLVTLLSRNIFTSLVRYFLELRVLILTFAWPLNRYFSCSTL